jgi:[ribosomal protein S18]-alanine N-acetyltransferase
VIRLIDLFRRPSPPTLARLTTRHAEECANVHASSFTFSWPPADLEALLLAPSTFADGAFDASGRLLGFILSRKAADEAEIVTIAVRPRWRRTGIAARLMKANMARLQAAGAASWFLEVEAQNAAALALYQRFGFERVGERKSYYRKADGENASALLLKRSLA